MDFKWIPGQGINQDAIERMKQHFKKPKNPPHIAWFMSGKPEYHRGVTEVEPPANIGGILFDLGPGVKNFGRRQDWVETFHYILPYALPLYRQGDIYVETVNYFINIYTRGYIKPDSHIALDVQRRLYFVDFEGGIVEEYPGFREDVFQTLGQVIMEPDLWRDGDMIDETIWCFDGNDTCFEGMEPLYAALFWCLMYLTPAEIPGWVESIAAIPGEQWQYEVGIWLSRLAKFHRYIHHPSEAEWPGWRPQWRSDKYTVAYYIEAAELYWNHYVVGKDVPIDKVNDFIPMVNVETFMAEVKKYPHLELDYDWAG